MLSLAADNRQLRQPPAPVDSMDLLTDAAPVAWDMATEPPRAALDDVVSALASQRDGDLPWPLVVDAVNEGVRSGRFIVDGNWPCDRSGAPANSLTLPKPAGPQPGVGEPTRGPGYSTSTGTADSSTGTATDEAMLSAFDMQKLGEVANELLEVKPTLKISFKVLVTAEGDVDPTTRKALNAVLTQATPKLRFE